MLHRWLTTLLEVQSGSVRKNRFITNSNIVIEETIMIDVSRVLWCDTRERLEAVAVGINLGYRT